MMTKILNLNREQITFWSLLSAIVFCLGFYMFCINATVHNVVTRQNLEAEFSELTLALGNQEFEYISKRNAITLSVAHELGFKEAKVKNYISKKDGTAVALLNR